MAKNNRQPDFFRQLNEQLLEQLEAYTREPGRTGAEVHAWLESKGVKTSLRAVYRWREDFLLEDKTQRATELAKSFLALSSDRDPNSVVQASLQKFRELVLERLMSGDEFDGGELMKLSIALKTGLNAQDLANQLDTARTQIDSLEKKATAGKVTAEHIAEARKAIFGV